MAVGDTIHYEWGQEVFNIGNYQSYRVGPFSMTTTVKPGETDEQALDRMHSVLSKHADKIFVAKRNEYSARVRANQV